MAHITELPKGLKYFEAEGKKVLDLRATCIDAVPRRLKGVDCILVNPRQLQYVAPDYSGSVMLPAWVIGAEKNDSPLSAFDECEGRKITQMKEDFSDMERLTNGFFNSPHKATGVVRSRIGEETHLPADLRFSWNAEDRKGSLDARVTWLTQEPEIEGIDEVHMPTEESLQALRHANHNARKKLRRKSERSDFGYIRSMTEGRYT